jgi:hypothetical protein
MRALFVGPGGSFVTACDQVLMLRDNVQHHLQAGRITAEYYWVHELADTVVASGAVSTPARALWTELARAFARLGCVRIEDLAMSIRTHGILSGISQFPAVRGTILVRLTCWRIPIASRGFSTLGELFTDLRRGLERVTAFGRSKARVEVSSLPTLLRVHS